MACQTCDTNCSTIQQLLVNNGCKEINSSKPTGLFISSYPLPELSSYASFDPLAPSDQTQFATDMNAKIDNSDVTMNDVIRCFCVSGSLPALEVPTVEDCDGTELSGSAKQTFEFISYDFSDASIAFLSDISNCQKLIYFYIKTEDLLIGSYVSDTKCFVPFKGRLRRNISFDGARGEVNSVSITITTSLIRDYVFWKQKHITGLDLNASCQDYN